MAGEQTFLNRVRRGLSRYLLDPVIPRLAASGVTPNQVSLAGLLIVIAGSVLAALGYLLPAGILVLLGSALDLYDGSLARATGRSSKKGAFLDSNLDRVGEIAVLLGVLVYSVRRDQDWEVVLAAIAMAGSLMVSYVRARAEGLGYRCDVGFFTRTERVVLTGAALIIGHLLIPLAILAVLTPVTAIHRFWDVWKRGE